VGWSTGMLPIYTRMVSNTLVAPKAQKMTLTEEYFLLTS
jgi:hypothetical protein